MNIKVVTIGKVGPPGDSVFYNFLDYTLYSDGTGVKNIDYGYEAVLTSELFENGKYRIISNKPLFFNSRINVFVLNNENPDNHILPKVIIISDVILEIHCINYELGGYTNNDLAITIQRLKT